MISSWKNRCSKEWEIRKSDFPRIENHWNSFPREVFKISEGHRLNERQRYTPNGIGKMWLKINGILHPLGPREVKHKTRREFMDSLFKPDLNMFYESHNLSVCTHLPLLNLLLMLVPFLHNQIYQSVILSVLGRIPNGIGQHRNRKRSDPKMVPAS